MKASRASRTVMLLALTCGFALSQAYRTVATLMAPQLQTDFAASPQALGVFAGAFHFAFGALQIFVGVGIDLQGIRRTVLATFPLAIAGSLLAASAQRFELLVLAQAMIGIGCAPTETAPPGGLFGDRPRPGGEDAGGDARTDGPGSDARDAGSDSRDADSEE